MLGVKLACTLMILGFGVIPQSFAGHALDSHIGRGQADRQTLALQAQEEADDNRAKAGQ